MFCTDGGKKGSRASFQRSEEVGVAADMKNRIKKQGSRESTDSSLASISSDSSALLVLHSSSTTCSSTFVEHAKLYCFGWY